MAVVETKESLVLHHGLANQLKGLQESSGFSTMGAFLQHLFALEEQSRSQQCLSALFTSVEQPWLVNYPANQAGHSEEARTASVGVQVKLCCGSTETAEVTEDEQSVGIESDSAEDDKDEDDKDEDDKDEDDKVEDDKVKDAGATYFESNEDDQAAETVLMCVAEEVISKIPDADGDSDDTQNTQVQIDILEGGELADSDVQKPASKRKSYFVKHPGYTCELCEAEFKHKLHYVHHMQDHKGEHKIQQCKYCPRDFINAWRLKLHVTAKHPEHAEPPRDRLPDEPILCHLCGLAMKSKHTFAHHLRSHSSERPYKCMFCPKTFKWASAQEYHRRTHTKERLYCCHLCDKKYRYQCNLANHQLSHSGVKPYKCPHCPQRFTVKPSMKEHIRKQHEAPGEKPYVCSYCHKAYSRKFSMNTHIRKKHHNPEQKSEDKSQSRKKRETHVGMTNVVTKGFRPTVRDTKVPLVPLVETMEEGKTKTSPVHRQSTKMSKKVAPDQDRPITVSKPKISHISPFSRNKGRIKTRRSRKHKQAEIELAEVMAGMLAS